MSKRMAEWGKLEKSRLMATLGNKCNACGSDRDLEFDCIKPQGWKHHKMNTSSRMCFYRKQMRMGNIQLLCAECNKLKGAGSNALFLRRLNTQRDCTASHTSIMPGEYSEELRKSLSPAGIHGEDL